MGITKTLTFAAGIAPMLSAAMMVGSFTHHAEATILYACTQTGFIKIDTTLSSPIYSTLTNTVVNASNQSVFPTNALGTSTTPTPNMKGGLVTDNDGNIYVGSNGVSQAFKITVSGSTYTPSYYGTPGGSVASIATDGTNLYIASSTAIKRASIGTAPTSYSQVGATASNSITGMAVTDNGTLYYTYGNATNGYYIYSIANAEAATTTSTVTVASVASTVGSFVTMATDGTNVYVVASSNRKIYVLGDGGSLTEIATIGVTGTTVSNLVYDEASNHLFALARASAGTSYVYEYATTGGSALHAYTLSNTLFTGLAVAPVPEVASLSVLAFGGMALLLRRRKD